MSDFYTDWCHWCKILDEKVYAKAISYDKENKLFDGLKEKIAKKEKE